MQIIKIDASLAHLVYELFDKYRVFYKQQSNIQLVKNFIDARLNNNESVIFAALGNDSLIPMGFTQLYPAYSSVHIIKNWILNDLYVSKAYRQQGIGTKLIEAAMDFAKNDNAGFIELSTAVDNYTAQKLYEQIGFKKQVPDNKFYTYRINLA